MGKLFSFLINFVINCKCWIKAFVFIIEIALLFLLNK